MFAKSRSKPIIERFIALGSEVMTDECDIYGRLTEWTIRTKPFATVTGSMPVTRTATATMKFTSTRWKVVGRYCGVGFGLTAAFHRNGCPLALVFSSLFTMLVSAATRYSDPSLKPSTRRRGRAIQKTSSREC